MTFGLTSLLVLSKLIIVLSYGIVPDIIYNLTSQVTSTASSHITYDSHLMSHRRPELHSWAVQCTPLCFEFLIYLGFPHSYLVTSYVISHVNSRVIFHMTSHVTSSLNVLSYDVSCYLSFDRLKVISVADNK